MTKEELAAKLTGAEYPFDPSRELQEAAKADGLVIVFGASDDLMEFRGAIYDELSAWEGTTAHLSNFGLLKNECGDDDCPYFASGKKGAATIVALWANEPGYSWTYETTIPHATFEVVEDGEPYCRGIVFSLRDVTP